MRLKIIDCVVNNSHIRESYLSFILVLLTRINYITLKVQTHSFNIRTKNKSIIPRFIYQPIICVNRSRVI